MTDVFDFTAGKSYWLASGRPSVRQAPIDRVIDHLATDGAVIPVDAAVGDARGVLGSSDRLTVVNDGDIVLGTVAAQALDGANDDAPVTTVMAPGPPTIRPDEETAAVRERMQRRGVRSLLVTTPTGRLLGTFSVTD